MTNSMIWPSDFWRTIRRSYNARRPSLSTVLEPMSGGNGFCGYALSPETTLSNLGQRFLENSPTADWKYRILKSTNTRQFLMGSLAPFASGAK
ncbi:MAG: hypothetical protein R3C03_16255 [Pirellulaceae bacterium]